MTDTLIPSVPIVVTSDGRAHVLPPKPVTYERCEVCGRVGALGRDVYHDQRWVGGHGYHLGTYCLGGCK